MTAVLRIGAALPNARHALGGGVQCARADALLIFAQGQREAAIAAVDQTVAVVVLIVTDLSAVVGPVVDGRAGVPGSGHTQSSAMGGPAANTVVQLAVGQQQIGIGRVRVPIAVVVRPITDLLHGIEGGAVLPARDTLAVFGACASSPTVRDLAGPCGQAIIDPASAIVVQAVAGLRSGIVGAVVQVVGCFTGIPASGHAQGGPVDRSGTDPLLVAASGQSQAGIRCVGHAIAIVVVPITALGSVVSRIG